MRLPTLTLFLLAAISSAHALAAPNVKVMSFNVRFDGSPGLAAEDANAWTATNGSHRRDLACRVVRESNPDILGVQEALNNQIADLQANLPDHDCYGVGRDDGEKAGEYCGIFYRRNRFTCRGAGTFWLNEDSSRPGSRFPGTCCARIATWCALQDNEDERREYLVLNTHWDHQVQDARVFSARLIRRKLKSLAEERPLIVIGDLNVTVDNSAFRFLVQPTNENSIALIDSYRMVRPEAAVDEGTFHGFRGRLDGNRIDYILHDSGFRSLRAEIVRTHVGKRYPSDHYPVVATLELVLD